MTLFKSESVTANGHSSPKLELRAQTEVSKLLVFQAQCVAHTIEIDRNSDIVTIYCGKGNVLNIELESHSGQSPDWHMRF